MRELLDAVFSRTSSRPNVSTANCTAAFAAASSCTSRLRPDNVTELDWLIGGDEIGIKVNRRERFDVTRSYVVLTARVAKTYT